MNRSAIILSIMIAAVALSIGGAFGWYRGLRHGANWTATVVQAEVQSHNTLLLLIEDAMNDPGKEKDESIRVLLLNGLDQYKNFQDVFERPPFSINSLHRNDLLIEEARNRLAERKIQLRYLDK